MPQQWIKANPERASALIQALMRGQQQQAASGAPKFFTGEGINPYTGQRLGANEYVGVAGSEAEHPGMTRIPQVGWWDPSNPNYERRNYSIGPNGQIVAAEAGYGSAEHPFDTGREGERNTEHERAPGWQRVSMSEPGITPWGPGQQRPELPGYSPVQAPQPAPSADPLLAIARGGRPDYGAALAPGLAGQPPVPAMPTGARAPNPQSDLAQALVGLKAPIPGAGRRPPGGKAPRPNPPNPRGKRYVSGFPKGKPSNPPRRRRRLTRADVRRGLPY